MKISKKKSVLIVLFVFPLVFFLLLSTGINNFEKLPLLTQKISSIKQLDSSQNLSFQNKVSILCFLGKEMDNKKGGFFNLNQKIYKEFYGYAPFQIIAIYPKGFETKAENLKSKMGAFTDMSRWKFASLSEKAITSLYQSLKTNDNLDQNFYSNRAYIIDKDTNLRGRNDDKNSENGLLYGYNINSVAELNNKMEDDVKVLLYEYRAAFKSKEKANSKKIGR